jgi:hypothetical protein
MAHYAFYNCEDTLPNEFPIGRKARESLVRAKVASVLEQKLQLCIDFEDFNSQHSTHAMRAVIHAYRDVHGHRLERDQVAAMEWTSASLDDVIIHQDQHEGNNYRSNGTLMSGWRLTTFVNSVLNYIYTQIMFKKDTNIRKSVHNGDDVLLGVTNFQSVTEALRTAKTHKIRLQRTKCAFGGIAEFLRVDHMRPGSGQYLSRNIATLMHSRIESKTAVTATDLIAANEERLGEFVSRGGNVRIAARLRQVYYKNTMPLYNVTINQCNVIKRSHRVVGGISQRDDADLDCTIEQEARSVESELPLDLPGVLDYAEKIKSDLRLTQNLDVIYQRLRRATLRAVQLTKYHTRTASTQEVKQAEVLRAIYKAYAYINEKPQFGKALMVGFVFEYNTKDKQVNLLRRRLAGSTDQMKMLSILV